MVSLRRRRLLGLCSGPAPFLDPRFLYMDKRNVSEEPTQDAKPVNGHRMPSSDVEEPSSDNVPEVALEPSNGFGPSGSKELHDQQFIGQEIKRRKQHRRKHLQNQEPCVMRGVYFKNMKWQAAIKVDKKQIHLGTVASQEAAAHLYDRAAFMCGREPNFELPEQEKRELTQYKWNEFLAITRSSITNKKHRRVTGAGLRKRSDPAQESSEELEGELGTNSLSASEAEPEISAAS